MPERGGSLFANIKIPSPILARERERESSAWSVLVQRIKWKNGDEIQDRTPLAPFPGFLIVRRLKSRIKEAQPIPLTTRQEELDPLQPISQSGLGERVNLDGQIVQILGRAVGH